MQIFIIKLIKIFKILTFYSGVVGAINSTMEAPV